MLVAVAPRRASNFEIPFFRDANLFWILGNTKVSRAEFRLCTVREGLLRARNQMFSIVNTCDRVSFVF
jgi:hypothetical protein